MKIGILYICTGRYIAFWKRFYETSEKYFIKNSEKHYFVFTDSLSIAHEYENSNIHRIFQENLGWPYNTLKRFEIFLKIKEQLANMNFLFFFNSNLIFLKSIYENNFLPKDMEHLLACLHPGFHDKLNTVFPFERNKNSNAYIPYGLGNYYVQGALQGGKSKYFLEAIEIMHNNTKEDLEKDIIASWHDESHWNKYILDRNDVKILTPSYLYPEGYSLPFEPIIKSLNKDYCYGGRNYLRGVSDVPKSNFRLIMEYYYWKVKLLAKKIFKSLGNKE